MGPLNPDGSRAEPQEWQLWLNFDEADPQKCGVTLGCTRVVSLPNDQGNPVSESFEFIRPLTGQNLGW